MSLYYRAAGGADEISQPRPGPTRPRWTASYRSRCRAEFGALVQGNVGSTSRRSAHRPAARPRRVRRHRLDTDQSTSRRDDSSANASRSAANSARQRTPPTKPKLRSSSYAASRPRHRMRPRRAPRPSRQRRQHRLVERPAGMRRQTRHARLDRQHVAPLVRRHPARAATESARAAAPAARAPAPGSARASTLRSTSAAAATPGTRRSPNAPMHHCPSAAERAQRRRRLLAALLAEHQPRRRQLRGPGVGADHAARPPPRACARSTRRPRRAYVTDRDRQRHQPLAEATRLGVVADDEVDARLLEGIRVVDRADEAAPFEAHAEDQLQRLLGDAAARRRARPVTGAPHRRRARTSASPPACRRRTPHAPRGQLRLRPRHDGRSSRRRERW